MADGTWRLSQMSFDETRVIDLPSSPNHGVSVKVDWDAQGYNPKTDELDDDWCQVMMPNGKIGGIERKYLK
jgi:hypothetical protein